MDPDMNAPLKRRFFKWVAPLIILLQAYGVDLHQLNRTRRTCRYSIRLWGWLLLLIQSLGFIGQYADRLLTFKLTVSQICNLTTRSNMLVTCSMITSFVIFMAGPRLASLINFLEKIDRSLNRPDLSFLYRRSLIGVFWILITVNFECGCSILNELNRKDYGALPIIQQIIKFQSLGPLMTTIFIYAICAQLLVTYYHQLAAQIQQNSKDLGFSLKTFCQLQDATEVLHDYLLFIIKANLLFIFLNLIQTTYHILIFGPHKNTLLFVWNTFATLDMFIRLWVICYSTDCIRNAAYNCIWALRKVRCNLMGSLSRRQRAQITLFIYEVSQQVKRKNRLPLGRNITFMLADYIISFAMFLWESRNVSLQA